MLVIINCRKVSQKKKVLSLYSVLYDSKEDEDLLVLPASASEPALVGVGVWHDGAGWCRGDGVGGARLVPLQRRLLPSIGQPCITLSTLFLEIIVFLV